MKKRFPIKHLLSEIMIASLITFGLYSFLLRSYSEESGIYIETVMIIPRSDSYQLFYHNKSAYNPKLSLSMPVDQSDNFQLVKFQLPKDTVISRFRLDFGDKRGTVIIKEISFYTENKRFTWKGNKLTNEFAHSSGLSDPTLRDKFVVFQISGEDPYLEIKRDVVKEFDDLYEQVKTNQQQGLIRATILLFFLLIICLRITGFSEKVFSIFSDPSKTLLTVFLIILFLPLFNMTFEFFPEVKNYEKRALKPKPFFSVNHFADYTKKYTEYFNDHFGFRSLYIKLNCYYKYGVLRSLPSPTVLHGKNDWLFPKEIFEPLSIKQLDTIEKNIERTSLALKQKGIDYYLVITPEKSYVYPEYFPEEFKNINICARMDGLVDRLLANKNIRIVDLRSVMIDAKSKQEELYYPSDTHWNMYGAIVGYTAVMNEIKKDHPDLQVVPLEGYKFEKRSRSGGDISFLFNAPEIFPMHDWVPTENGKDMYPLNYIDTPHTLKYSQTNEQSKNKKKVVLLHDSYALYWRAPLRRDFYQSSVNWTNYYDKETIEETNPDIVIHELVSRYVPNLMVP